MESMESMESMETRKAGKRPPESLAMEAPYAWKPWLAGRPGQQAPRGAVTCASTRTSASAMRCGVCFAYMALRKLVS